MGTIFNSSEKFNELIFENKNKVYGAYALRSAYKDNLLIAVLSTAAFFGILVYLTTLFGKGIEKLPDTETNTAPIIVEREVVIPQKPEVLPEKPKAQDVKPPEPPNTQNAQLVTSDDKKDALDKTNDQFTIAKENNDKGNDNDSSGTITVKSPETGVGNPPAPPKEFVTDMPEFENLQKYISQTLVYPQIAKENGTEGIVGISFIVELDGTLSDIKIVKSIGDGCEQEALRVVKTMKKWKPGKHNGVPQRVLLTLPIKFRLN